MKPERVRAIRLRLGLSQRGMAEMLGLCEPKTILLWERNGCAGPNAVALSFIEKYGPPHAE